MRNDLIQQENETALCLPWPPSVNSYWIPAGFRGGLTPSVKAREYRVEVAAIVRGAWPHAITLARLRVSIIAHPPDRRKRDLDNILKPLLDVLAHADVYKDDCQIDALTIERAEIIKGGEVIVLIEELPDSS